LFDARKSGMIGLPYGEKNYDDMLSRFHTIPACHGRTNGRTDRIAISISRVSSRMLTRDKNTDWLDLLSKEFAVVSRRSVLAF